MTLTALKIGEGETILLPEGQKIYIHPNKEVKECEPVPEDVSVRFGHTHEVFLCSPIAGGRVVARRVIVVDTKVMFEKELKAVKSGGKQGDLAQVYIMLSGFEKYIQRMTLLAQTMKAVIEDGLTDTHSDNEFMSTSEPGKPVYPLPE